MQPSIAGALVCVGILAVVRLTGWSVIVAFMASLAFGATAIGTLPSLGGSSPLIYTIFVVLIAVSATARRGIWQDIGHLFGRHSAASIVVLLLLYAIAGSILFPRLFAGQTSVFVSSRSGRGVYETALAPVSANITQTGYFALAVVAFLSFCLLLKREGAFADVRRGFFMWFGLHTAMGIVDLLGKMAGGADILAPIRTATYAMLTLTQEEGFWRIAGAHSEASTFGSASLAGLAFSYTYWRKTGSRLAACLALVLLLLLVLSTSTTAYVGLSILALPVLISLAWSVASGRVTAQELLLLVLLVLMCVVTMAIVIQVPRFFEPLQKLFDEMVFNKMSSASGKERAYWNYKSLQAFLDSGGLGIGLGSSRASSWAIAVLSQLGFVGALIFAVLIARLVSGARQLTPNTELQAIVSSARACAIAALLSVAIAGGHADPGMAFFISLAVVVVGGRQEVPKLEVLPDRGPFEVAVPADRSGLNPGHV